MRTDRFESSESTEPLACTLGPDEARGQLDEWAALAADALTVDRSEGLLIITLAADRRPHVEDLAARERACCSFLDITVSEDGDGVLTVRVASPEPAADATVDFIGRRP